MAMAALPRSSLWGSRLTPGAAPATNAGILSRPSRLVVEAKKKIEGIVVSASNDKTVAVEVTRLVVDMKIRKRLKRSKRYQAHDEDNLCKLGDVATLAMSRPYSKTKRFIVTAINGKLLREEEVTELPPLQSVVESRVEEREVTTEEPSAEVVVVESEVVSVSEASTEVIATLEESTEEKNTEA